MTTNRSPDSAGVMAVAIDLTLGGYVLGASYGHRPFAVIELTGATDDTLQFEAVVGGGLETDPVQAAELIELFTATLRSQHADPGDVENVTEGSR